MALTHSARSAVQRVHQALLDRDEPRIRRQGRRRMGGIPGRQDDHQHFAVRIESIPLGVARIDAQAASGDVKSFDDLQRARERRSDRIPFGIDVGIDVMRRMWAAVADARTLVERRIADPGWAAMIIDVRHPPESNVMPASRTASNLAFERVILLAAEEKQQADGGGRIRAAEKHAPGDPDARGSSDWLRLDPSGALERRRELAVRSGDDRDVHRIAVDPLLAARQLRDVREVGESIVVREQHRTHDVRPSRSASSCLASVATSCCSRA